MSDKSSTFIQHCATKYNNKYDYSSVVYINTHTKVVVRCPTHGEFQVRPVKHKAGQECPHCTKDARIRKRCRFNTFEQVIEACDEIHGRAYEYVSIDAADQITTNSRLLVACPTHGLFTQTVNKHIYQKTGCPVCGSERTRAATTKTNQHFQEDAIRAHGKLYDYSQVDYVNAHTNVTIGCAQHGTFQQTPANHILKQQGCPMCSASSPELIIAQWLKENNIEFIPQAVLPGLVGQYGHHLRFDFALPCHRVLIEYDGIYHYRPIVRGGDEVDGLRRFARQQLNDNLKTRYAQTNGWTLLRIPHFDVLPIRARLACMIGVTPPQ